MVFAPLGIILPAHRRCGQNIGCDKSAGSDFAGSGAKNRCVSTGSDEKEPRVIPGVRHWAQLYNRINLAQAPIASRRARAKALKSVASLKIETRTIHTDC